MTKRRAGKHCEACIDRQSHPPKKADRQRKLADGGRADVCGTPECHAHIDRYNRRIRAFAAQKPR